ncbi:DUF3221 domain-containing protein [Halobacillus litoralis]|uniref:DUF3221 domain-containing protein n=1 Tax=Halobacillus litoralis TaxID=45668 RepID=UPI001CFEEB83|nr:DUF3221 domain-containing protein [Halobacillus litoralis]
MRRWWLIGCLVILVLHGCGTAQTSEEYTPNDEKTVSETPDITGFVMNQKEDRLLVVTPMIEASKTDFRAMWVSGVPKGTWVGKQVEVWINGEAAESFPEQAEADKVQELEMSEVQGADLKASEALSTALAETTDNEQIFAVELLSFNAETDQWTVELHQKGSSDGDNVKTTVKDER